eukprot:gene14608-13161_t
MHATFALLVCAHAVGFGPPRRITTSFNYTGNVQEYVPAKGVVAVEILVCGADGGPANNGYKAAKGGCAAGSLPVAPWMTFSVVVGGAGGVSTNAGGTGGYNGGGAASPVAGGSGDDGKRRIVVGGGGGGAPINGLAGGGGGGEIGGRACPSQYESTPAQAGGQPGGSRRTGGSCGSVAFCAGGGGGYYGGGSGARGTYNTCVGGGGGSGYVGGVINGTFLKKEHSYINGVSTRKRTTVKSAKLTMIPLLLGIGVLAAPAVKQARYSRSESYAGQYVQRCNLTGVAVANKQALVNLDTHNAEYVDVRIINGEDAAMLKSLVPEEQCTIVVDDVEQLVLAAEKDLNTSHSNAAEWFDEYHTYEEIIG